MEQNCEWQMAMEIEEKEADGQDGVKQKAHALFTSPCSRVIPDVFLISLQDSDGYTLGNTKSEENSNQQNCWRLPIGDRPVTWR